MIRTLKILVVVVLVLVVLKMNRVRHQTEVERSDRERLMMLKQERETLLEKMGAFRELDTEEPEHRMAKSPDFPRYREVLEEIRQLIDGHPEWKSDDVKSLPSP